MTSHFQYNITAMENIGNKNETKSVEPMIIINFLDKQIKLKPGPVYCFYSETKFPHDELYPTVHTFYKKVRKLNVESIILKGKPIVDPYYVEWVYHAKYRFNSIIEKMEKRSVLTQKNKAMSNFEKQKSQVLSKLKEGTPDYLEAQKELEKQSNYIQDFWNARLFEEYIKNEQYDEPFTQEEFNQYKYFQTKDLKHLYKAKIRALDGLDEYRNFWVESMIYPIRLMIPMNRQLAGALKRNKRWKRQAPYFKFTSFHFKHTFLALNNYKVGFVGCEDITFAKPDKTIGENLIKILKMTNDYDDEKAREEALRLLNKLNIYNPEEVMNCYLWQFINDDMHYKILLSYQLAFRPEILIVDKSALNTGHQLTKELYQFITKLKNTFHFIFVIYDDTMFDKDFKNMVTYKVTKDGNIVDM